MKFSELKGRAVINLEDAKKIGDVEDLWVDVNNHHIVSLKVKTGMFSASQVVPVAEVKSVGQDAVTILAHDPNNNSQPDQGQRANPSSQDVMDMTDIIGNRVVTDTGTLVGEVQDVELDPTSWTITGYQVREGGLFTKPQEIPATPDVRYGKKLLTVPAASVEAKRDA